MDLRNSIRLHFSVDGLPMCSSAVASRLWRLTLGVLVLIGWLLNSAVVVAQNRFATSDNLSGYVHWIHLYDESNSRIEPGRENLKPYSPEKTCGRCHDYEAMSHGWHFNAVSEEASHGRPGLPWMWNDERTGTHLPLSYRGWEGTYNPDDLGLTRWQVAAKLGGYLPGGGVGSAESLAATPPAEGEEDRSKITGALPIDCMLCHHENGSGYSPFVWTEQIEEENFAFAPTAAMGLGTIEGSMSRLRNFDPNAEDAASKLPQVVYEESRFREDGTVFFDVVRTPRNDACYYCHSDITTDMVQGQRWLHDEDVHLRAGMACADCHRNGLEHHTVRGFEGEQHPAGTSIASLSCEGCHVGQRGESLAGLGRLGAPRPEHKGLPPVHFDKLSCTACHSGPLPAEQAPRFMNSMAHRLGDHVKRTGEEFPGIVGGVWLQTSVAEPVAPGQAGGGPAAPTAEAGESGSQEAEEARKYTPHRMVWPSYWGLIQDGKVTPLNPEAAYELVRRPLRTRNFTEDLADVDRQLNLSKRTELLGEERARAKPEDWTEEEQAIIEKASAALREKQVNENMYAALEAIEEEYPEAQAVYISGGTGFVRATNGQAAGDSDAAGDNEQADQGGEELPSNRIVEVDAVLLGDAAAPYAWPLAHPVRSAQQSLGVTGCLECHSDGALVFNTEVKPVGLLPDQQTAAVGAYELQGADMVRLSTWDQLFAGRSLFKIAGLAALGLACVITLCAIAVNVGSYWRR